MREFNRADFPSYLQQAKLNQAPGRRSMMVPLRMLILLAIVIEISNSAVLAQAGGNRNAGKKPASKASEKAADPIDADTLPPSFHPLPEPLAIMKLVQPIATPDEIARLRREFGGRFTKVLRDCDLSANGKQIVENGLRFKLAEMTLETKQSQIPDLRKTLMREIGSIGNPTVKPAEVVAMTQFVNQEIVKQIPELLVNNFYVRLHAVLILSEIDFAPAHVLLLRVIQAKDISEDEINGQPEAIKIRAVQGLIRILKFASPAPSVKDRSSIAAALVQELAKNDTHWWYQLCLIEALRNMTVSIDTINNKAFVVDALLDVMKDPKREWTVRAKACYAIGRVPIPPFVKIEDVVTAVADCALQLANAAQAKPNNRIWKECFWDLYLAFKPDGTKDKDGKDKDLDAERKVVGGLLARFKPAAQPAYDVIVPICAGVIQGKAPDPGDVLKLGGFVRARLAQNAGANKNTFVDQKPQGNNYERNRLRQTVQLTVARPSGRFDLTESP